MTQINRRHQLNCGGPRSASVALRSLTQFTATALLISASACGGGNSTPPAYTIGGTVAGLATGAQLTLANSGGNALTVTANGAFTFTTPVAFNGSYAVTIGTQPTGQTCAVSGGTGTAVAANVTNVSISCSTNTYTIGGTVAGLATGAQLTLANSGGNALTVTANGAFTFTTPVAFNGSYAVTIGTQPTGQTCAVSGGSGTGVAANVTNVSISCSTNTYTIGGTVAGLATGAQLMLANSGGNTLTVTANGAFTFTTPVAFNGSYAVTIGTQPTGQTCAVSGGTGTAVAANVTNVSISCSTNTYTIGGTVAGLATGAQLTLVNSGSNTLTVTANGAFTFTTPVAFNGSYAVTVRTQPTGQTCAVSGGTGTGVAANVTNVGVSCATNTYTIGGTVSGLTTGAQLTLVNSGSNALTVTANGAFTFSTPVVFNGSYAVIVGTQPTGQICTVSGGSGTSVAANVTNVSVSCAITIGYAYTANNSDSTLSQYAIVTGGSLMPLTPSTVMSGGLSYPKSVAVDPSGHYAYVTNAGLGPSGSGGSTVSEYAINAGGVLVPLSISTVATALNPSSIAIDPTDRFAYVVNTGEIAIGGSGGNAISQYAIGAGGELVPMNPATVATGHLPNSIAIDPTGQYAYVANTFGSDSTISQYMIGTSGALTPMSTPTVATGATPYIVIVDPTGRYVYCVNFSGNSVSQYTIGAGGALTQMATATVAAGLRPASIAVDPTGHYAYVTNTGDFTVSQYMIGAGGALAPLNPATVTTGESSISLTIDATGHFVFLADDNDNTVSQYMIGVGGALAPLSPTTVTTGIGPEGITTTH